MPPNSNQHNIVQKDVQIAHSGLSIVWGVEGGGGGRGEGKEREQQYQDLRHAQKILSHEQESSKYQNFCSGLLAIKQDSCYDCSSILL